MEHEFVSLIWGIETFHRVKHPEKPASSRVQNKIQRIIDQIKLSRDRKWLAEQLEHAHEPSLETRIFQVLRELPIEFDDKGLKKFAHECAERRNAISHFGGQRQRDKDGTTTSSDLMKKGEVLGYLYHTLIMQEIGIEKDILRQWLYEGFRSYHIKRILREAGLLVVEAATPS